MAKKKVSQKPTGFKVPNMSINAPQKASIIGAFTWGQMTDIEKRDYTQLGVMVAMAPHQWENMMREQSMAAQAKDNLREELRVSNLKLANLDERFRNEQVGHLHHVESLRDELSKAREEVVRITRAMHALIDGIASPRAQMIDRHTLPDGRAFALDETTKRFRQV